MGLSRIRSIDFQQAPEAEAVGAATAEVTERGAVIMKGVVPPSLVSRMGDELHRAMEEDTGHFGSSHPFPGMVHALMTRGSSFVDLLGISAIRGVSRAILGHGAIVHAFNSSSLPPGQTNYAGRIHVDSPRQIPGYVSNIALAFPIDHFREQNGAMEIWPESFSRVTAPTQEEFDEEKVILADLAPGDGILFNARCWHQSGVNTTGQWRRAVTMNVCRAFMRQQFDFPRMIPREVAEPLSEDLRQFLGYHVRMPVSMEEFLAPPDRRPYRSGQE